MRLFSILTLSLLLGAGLLAPSLAAADCAGHGVTASSKPTDTVAEAPGQTPAPTTTTTTPTTGG
ncbi:MAG: hypothetical protein SGJ07_17780 [Rhodospirillaceae bacterium]|nr:hypothetical protein [Rhodospirillaceae bacterium]